MSGSHSRRYRPASFWRRLQAIIDEEDVMITELARAYGVPVSTCHRHLRHPLNANIDKKLAEIRRRVAAGQTVASAAFAVGIATKTAFDHGIRANPNVKWSRRRKWRR